MSLAERVRELLRGPRPAVPRQLGKRPPLAVEVERVREEAGRAEGVRDGDDA